MKKIYLIVFILISAFTVSAQWNIIHSDAGEYYNEVFFVATDTGYVIGNDGVVLKTTDGGTSWQHQTFAATNNLNDIFFTNPSTGIVVGDSGLVAITSDGGSSWNISYINSANDRTLNAAFINGNTFYIGGAKNVIEGFIAYSTDGINWTEGFVPTTVNDILFKKITFPDVNIGYAITRGIVFKTIDAGANWFITDSTSVGSGIMFSLLEDMQFFGVDTGYVAGWYNPYFGTTYNGAQQWNHNSNYQVYSMDFMNISTGYIAGWCYIYKTTDGGQTFVDASGGNATIGCSIYSIDFTDEWTGYACGEHNIIKTTNGGATSINELNASELKVFPNPSVSKVKIEWSDLISSIQVSICDINGKLLSSFSDSGKKSLEFDVSDLSEGVYYCKVITEDFTISKKLIVVRP